MALDDYGDIKSVEPILQRLYDGASERLSQRGYYVCDMFRKKAKGGKIGPAGVQIANQLYSNPNVGAGTARDGFREPGSPGYGALLFFPVGTHITGGVDGDTLDALETQGMKILAADLAGRIADDLKSYKNERERNFFHGASGERAVVGDVAGTPITYSSTLDESTVLFDDEWGVRHLNEGGVYQPYSGTTRRGNPSGYKCTSKTPSSKTAKFQGDLTAATLGSDALAAADIFVNLGCFNAERDGLPEMLGNSGQYGGGDRDTQFRYQGTQVTCGGFTLSVTILEKCDTIKTYIMGEDYDASKLMDLTSPTAASQLAQLAYANYSINMDKSVARLGFTAVRYKDRVLMIANNCSWKEWYQLNMGTMHHRVMRKLGLFQNKAASTVHESRSATGVVEDMYHWVWYEKGQDFCEASRHNLLLYNIAQGSSDAGHWN